MDKDDAIKKSSQYHRAQVDVELGHLLYSYSTRIGIEQDVTEVQDG